MLTNQVLYRTLHDISSITGASCSVWSMDAVCRAYTDERAKGLKLQVEEFIKNYEKQDVWLNEPYALFFVYDKEEPEYVLAFIGLRADSAEIQGRLCVSQFGGLIEAYKEKLDKNRFIRNVILASVPADDLYQLAKKLKITSEISRIVVMIESIGEEDPVVLEMMKRLYAVGTSDFVTAIGERYIVLVKTLEKSDGYNRVEQITRGVVDTLNTEAMVNVRAAYGTIVQELKELPRSFQEAKIALEVGRIFYAQRSVLAYKELGIGRLIHQLPRSLCNVFLEEVFAGQAEELFDEETLAAVNKFFEYNLNISETARQLYLHRNTLMYRLEKVQKKTGLDVRAFDDAVTFKIAMMVSTYVKYYDQEEEKSND